MAGRDEGVIKFDCVWNRGEGPPPSDIMAINAWRTRCFEMGLVGQSSDGIGFGNLSVRVGATPAYWITGSGTGGLPKLSRAHYTRVVEALPDRNRVVCEGPVRASSESMTHAVLYATIPTVQAVIHVHSAALWQSFIHRLPTTPGDVAYGTPAMSRAVAELAATAEGGVIVMGGHEDGLIAFGRTPDEAGERLLALTVQEKG